MSGLDWTQERIDQLVVLHKEGYSCSEIAARLHCGFSRNAIIGKVHRLGLGTTWTKPGPKKPSERRPPRSHVVTLPTTSPCKPLTAKMRVNSKPHHPPLHPPPAPTGKVTMAEIRNGLCRFIVGEAKGWESVYCGQTSTGPYCRYHSELCSSFGHAGLSKIKSPCGKPVNSAESRQLNLVDHGLPGAQNQR